MALTEDETNDLVRLLGKMEWPLDPRVFRMLLGKTVSVALELAVLDREDRILTFYRKDEEYDGHHMPGTVLRANEAVWQALRRLLRNELCGNEVHSIKNIGWAEVHKGRNLGDNPTRHEVSLLHVARLRGAWRGEEGTFSSLDLLPENILPHHRLLVEKFKRYLRTGAPVLGY